MKIDIGIYLRRLLAHIRPRRSVMERRGYSIYRADGCDYIVPMPGAINMSKRRAR